MIKRDKEGHYIMVKGSMQQEELTILNIYAPNIGAPRFLKNKTKQKKELALCKTVFLCRQASGWSAVACSQLTATSTSWVQAVLLPQLPE